MTEILQTLKGVIVSPGKTLRSFVLMSFTAMLSSLTFNSIVGSVFGFVFWQ